MSTWSLQSSNADPAPTSLRRTWRELLAVSNDPFAIYQSPEWFDLVRSGIESDLGAAGLVVRRDVGGNIVGVVPLFSAEGRSVFPLAMGRSYVTRPKRILQVPSGHLLLPAGDHYLDRFFHRLQLLQAERDVIEMARVPVGGPMETYLKTSPAVNREYCLFEAPGRTKIHTIPLPMTYDAFLGKYSSKKRYNLRRQFRQLQERTTGGLALRCYRAPEEASAFLDHWDRLAEASHPPLAHDSTRARRGLRIRRLAELGLLCSYILLDGTRPIAGWLALRSGRVLLLDMTLHDRGYSGYSPGVCLLHLVIRQLIEEQTVELINLGYGHPAYESRSTNVLRDYRFYWLFPRTWRTRLFQVGYHAFRRGTAAAKAIWHDRPARRPGEADGASQGDS